jgi:AraC-like DNA-binding protein
MVGPDTMSIVMFTLNTLSAFLFFVLALVFFVRRVLNPFFSLLLVVIGIVTLAFSFDFEFIQTLRRDDESSALFHLVSFCILVMVPLYYLSVRRFVGKPFTFKDIPLSLFAVFVVIFSFLVGWPPIDPLFMWGRWILVFVLFFLACALSLRLLIRFGREEAEVVSYETKTLSFMGALFLIVTVASSFVELADPQSSLKLVSMTMSGSLFVFLIYVLTRSPELLRRSKAKYADSVLGKAAAVDLFVEADKLIKEEKLFKKFGFSLADLAARMGANVRYLSQAVNQTTGKNFNQFINEYRLEEARRLLRETDENSTDIGFSVGFNSLSSFYEQFKKAEGLTPEQYRKKKA